MEQYMAMAMVPMFGGKSLNFPSLSFRSKQASDVPEPNLGTADE